MVACGGSFPRGSTVDEWHRLLFATGKSWIAAWLRGKRRARRAIIGFRQHVYAARALDREHSTEDFRARQHASVGAAATHQVIEYRLVADPGPERVFESRNETAELPTSATVSCRLERELDEPLTDGALVCTAVRGRKAR